MKAIASIAVILPSVLLSAATTLAAPTPLATCGQTVLDGVLTADLDCSATRGFAVTLQAGGSLDLGGFTLTGGGDFDVMDGVDLAGGVRCIGACTVHDGTIVAPAGLPPGSWQTHGAYANEYEARGTLQVANVTASGWTGTGVRGNRVEVTDSTLIGNQMGVSGVGSTTVTGCTLQGNVRGMQASRSAEVADTSISDCVEIGLWGSRRTMLTNVTITNSGDAGLYVRSVRAEGSTIDGSCQNGVPHPCADIVARRRPKLSASTCGTSLKEYKPESWNVCTMD